ncbi:MAG: peptidoglycan-binding protein [Candidatus Aureabacteria bacterium]|nr:peptidoglycan-binding protein [Candidatus Auribacterota bacterium]
MYINYYGLKEQPFNLTPDSHFLYLSNQHRDALGHLLYGIRGRKGFMLVSGEVGTGKTTLCRALIKVGQPELSEKLEQPELRQLAQRISVSYHLQPLKYREMAHYIAHRLHVAAGTNGNGDGKIPPIHFTRAALRRIYLYSEGIPRKINILCDRALLVGYVRGRKKIGDRVVRLAIEELQKHPRAARGRATRADWWQAVARAGVAAGAVALIMFGVVRYAVRTYVVLPAPRPAAQGSDHMAARIVPTPPAAPVPAPKVPEEISPEARVSKLLASLWGVQETGPGTPSTDPAILAGRYGLNAIGCWADVRYLRAVNVPCILRMEGVAETGADPVVLRGLRGETAALLVPDGREVSVPASKIDAGLRDRATFFYPASVPIPGVLSPGMRGGAVARLQGYLDRVGLPADDERGVYGPATSAQVRRFQERYGLPVDGVTGVSEWILLMSGEAAGSVPRLNATGAGE